MTQVGPLYISHFHNQCYIAANSCKLKMISNYLVKTFTRQLVSEALAHFPEDHSSFGFCVCSNVCSAF